MSSKLTGLTAVPAGPLAGVSVIDVSTMGPGPFASMVLADFGAEVIEIRRPVPNEVDAADQFMRGKQLLTDRPARAGRRGADRPAWPIRRTCSLRAIAQGRWSAGDLDPRY